MRTVPAIIAAAALVACADGGAGDAQQPSAEADTPMDPAAANLAEAEAYLAENGTRDGVVTTESGLQYEVVSSGPEGGVSPEPGQWVCVHYRGTFLDGEEFDSSYSRNQAAAFPSNGVIDGWVEALSMMTPGDVWRLALHPDLAYGPQGRPGIPPNAALLFEVELISLLDGPVARGVDCAES